MATLLIEDKPKIAEQIHHAILTRDPYHEVYRVLGHGGYNEIADFGLILAQQGVGAGIKFQDYTSIQAVSKIA